MVGAREIEVDLRDYNHIRVLRKQLIDPKLGAVVVYVPVRVFSDGVEKMNMLRFESDEKGQPIIREEVLAETVMSAQEFRDFLAAAQNPRASAFRTQLRERLFSEDSKADKGKMVFFKDLFYYGLLPKTFGIKGAITIGSGTVREAYQKSIELTRFKLKPNMFTGFMGYPETQAEYEAVFGGKPAADLKTWKNHAAELRNIASEYNFEILSATEFEKLGTKQQILSRFEEAEGIVFIVAHADGCHIRLPSGEVVELTPADISRLSLKKSPFVILRICNGIDNGYANAFVRAGARGVWANRGTIDVSIANKQVKLFMDFLHKGFSVMDAANEVDLNDKHSKVATGIFTE